ncbi:hypothetical protein FB451DRAFT_1388138 [Mycena latifolia]|nr:hypothetical protein FB451DRAFT_1388138 [Mycena latifolia]
MRKDPVNENRFPMEFREGDDSKYSEADSEQTSSKLWSIYTSEAQRYDTALVESWKADMEGMLIFSGLFSASLTAFLIESYKTLQPDTGSMTVEILSQIYQQLGAASTNTPSRGSFRLSDTSTFQPAPSSLLCNTLWFLSLCLSITCALLATLVEQWAREFIHKSDKRPSPIQRARIFSFLYFGVRRFRMHMVVDLIPLLLHVALILFLGGLIAFLLPINRMMMALIGGVLAVFLILYAVMTLLPIGFLDCPYHTPFSGLFWNLLRAVRNQPTSSPVSATSNITDTIVQVALRKSESRDRRAFTWMLESLTDNSEFVPFLEAIPEAIQGVRGFHLVNDYLFVPLLNNSVAQRSLGGRIGDLLLSCQSMAPTDPMRYRAFFAAAKAIWALGMTSGRTGDMFDHQGSIWFDDRTAFALCPFTSLPTSKTICALAAISYSRMNNLRNSIANLVRSTDLDRVQDANLVQQTPKILEQAKKASADLQSAALAGHLKSLGEASSSGAAGNATQNVLGILSAMITDEVWLEVNVTIVAGFLLTAAQTLHRGENLPDKSLQTCFKIVPVVPFPDPGMQRMKRDFPDYYVDMVNPSRHTVMSQDILGIHWIMRCFLRILPYLHPADAMPIILSYLGNCEDTNAVEFATRECHLPYLMDSLVATLELKVHDSELILQGISVITILSSFNHHLRTWADRDDKLWNYLIVNNMLSPPLPSAIPIIMTQRKIAELLIEARSLEEHSCIDDNDMDKLRRMVADPLLPASPTDHILLREHMPHEHARYVQGQARQAGIAILTDFLLACMESVRPVHMYATLTQITNWLAGSFEGVDLPSLTSLANATVILTTKAIKDATDHEWKLTTSALFLWLSRALTKLSPLSTEPLPAYLLIFKDAARSYLQFLGTESGRNVLGRTRIVLSELAVHMAQWPKVEEDPAMVRAVAS